MNIHRKSAQAFGVAFALAAWRAPDHHRAPGPEGPAMVGSEPRAIGSSPVHPSWSGDVASLLSGTLVPAGAATMRRERRAGEHGEPLWLVATASATATSEEEEAPSTPGRAALTRAMDRHADGDPTAFAEVYDLLSHRLFAFFLRRTRDRARAEDLVQQTLLQMHCARQSYVRGSDVVPWAFAIGRRLLIDAHRRRKNEVLFDSAEDARAALDGRASREDIPEEVASTHEIAARVRRSLDALPEGQRTAYVLVREDGLSVAEAAEVMGITVTAVKLRAHRVYEHLRGVLKSCDGASSKARQRA
jgi:RNA polymerase sigma-70 factor (ECF subfamily)